MAVVESQGWDWERIAASDYPVIDHPGSLRRDVVYCEFWGPGPEGGYVTGLYMPWSEWRRFREKPFTPAPGVSAARFSIWTAFVNPRFPRHVVGVWSAESGLRLQG